MDSQERLSQLASKSVGRLLWQYSLPSVVGMLVMALYNVADRIFIGNWVGPDAIAGLAVTFPIMNLATAIGVLVGVGASAKVSIDLGMNELGKAEETLGNALTLTFINAAIYMSVFYIYLEPLLRAFGASDATLPYAAEYMKVLMPGLLLTNIAYGMNNIMRASGYPRRAMYTMLIGAVVNVGLDPLFIYVFGWGIGGAAWATVIAMAVSAAFVMHHFFRKGVTLRLHCKSLWLKWPLVAGIIAIGAAPALVNAASCAINAMVNNSLADLGTDRDIGAAGIMVTFTSLLVTIVLGFCQGAQPIIGYNYGSGNYHRLKHAYFLAVGAATTVTTVGAVVGLLFPRQVGMVFTDDTALLDATQRALSICLWVFPVVGFQVISSMFFQSIGKARQSIFLSLLRQVIFMIPFLLFFPKFWDVDGVWLSFPLSDLCATVLTFFLIYMQLRQFSSHGRTASQAR